MRQQGEGTDKNTLGVHQNRPFSNEKFNFPLPRPLPRWASTSGMSRTCLYSQPQCVTSLWPVLVFHPGEGRRLSWPVHVLHRMPFATTSVCTSVSSAWKTLKAPCGRLMITSISLDAFRWGLCFLYIASTTGIIAVLCRTRHCWLSVSKSVRPVSG